MKKKMSAKKFGAIFIPITAVLLVLSLVATGVMQYWSTVMDAVFGSAQISITPATGTENWNTDYYGLNASGMTKEQTALDGQEVARRAEGKGIVLLKNQDNTLPLTNNGAPLSSSNPITINGLGWSFYYPSLGGSGSGAVGSNDLVSVTEALAASNININQGLSDYYVDWSNKHYTDWQITKANGYPEDHDTNTEPQRPSMTNTFRASWDVPELNAQEIGEACDQANAADNKVQIVWVGRAGGEYHDAPRVMTKTGGSVNKYGVNPNKHYLELTDEEEAVLAKAKELRGQDGKVIVVINANNTMELGNLQDDPMVDAILFVGGPGKHGFYAIGDVLCGAVNPSGRLADIYPADLLTSPVMENFGSDVYYDTNGEFDNQYDTMIPYLDGAKERPIMFVSYEEGIYMGYRFYETAAADGYFGTQSADSDPYYNRTNGVIYPFGYGLSYTTFSQSIKKAEYKDGTFTFDVEVTNTGSVAGKDVVELYVEAPYYANGIEKAKVTLCGFDKTQILEPGKSETMTITVDQEDIASYDSRGLKTANGGYVLEAGEYTVSIRSDSHTVLSSETFTVDSDIDYSVNGRDSDGSAATNQFQDYSAGNVAYLSRADSFANYDQVTAAPATSAYAMDDETYERVKAKTVAFYDASLYDNSSDTMPTLGKKNGLTLAEFTGADYDDPRWEDLLDQLTAEEMGELVNLGGFQTIAIDSIGKVASLDSDGPAGLNNWYVQVYGTPYPSETLLSQSWNKELAYRVGHAMAQEFADAGSYGWYGPAMNTHRSAFAGRNFEYYSEDGVLAGWIASNVVNAASEKGVYAYIKHFVLNDQETNRNAVILTWSDEQAIREIYLKPFEIVIKNFDFESKKPVAMMSSFNLIGPIYSGSNPYLLNNVLRGEWNFQGMVLTDWDGSYGYQITDDCVRNGNDIMLGFNSYESNKLDLTSPTLVQALRQASKNVLYTLANSGYYTDQTSMGGMDKMTSMFVTIDVVVGLIIAAAAAIVTIRWRKKQTQA